MADQDFPGNAQHSPDARPGLRAGTYGGGVILAKALVDAGVTVSFGIPGTHNIELYDALSAEGAHKCILVTDEQSAGFMADGAWRASGQLAALNLVPGAGLTHALSGIAEAYFDQIPMLVLMCAPRLDVAYGYQLHAIDQTSVAVPITKAVLSAKSHQDLYNLTLYAAALAKTAPMGPVAVEVPADLLLHVGEFSPTQRHPVPPPPPGLAFAESDYQALLRHLRQARHINLYVGLGALDAAPMLPALAEALNAQVFTSISGKGVFPENHPRFVWNGMGRTLPPQLRGEQEVSDCLLAIGCRFGEVATGSYGFELAGTLLHVDVDPSVLQRNYPAEVALAADAAAFVARLLADLKAMPLAKSPDHRGGLRAAAQASIRSELAGAAHAHGVNPQLFFEALQKQFGASAVYVTDSGNGLFKAMESLRLERPRSFLAPVDYSCMGYAVPAAIGAKLAAPQRPVVACVGDGAALMTGLEMLTARTYNLGILFVILNDGKLGQIAQFQAGALGREELTTLRGLDFAALAQAVGLSYALCQSSADLPEILHGCAASLALGKPVLLDLAINYDIPSFFTRGVLKTNFHRLPWSDRLRMGARLIKRKLLP